MAPSTRRRLLTTAAAGFCGALAGCNEFSPGERSETPGDHGLPNVERDPKHLSLRGPEDRALYWLAEEETDEHSPSPSERHGGRELIASVETADRVRFPDHVDADAAGEFLAETDFESETVYVESRRVNACFELRLCYVEWASNDVETQYGSSYRDPDVRCETDERQTAAVMIRIPDALDPDRVRSYGSGWSSSACRSPRRDRTETSPPGSGPLTDDGETAGRNQTEGGPEQ